MNNDGQRMDTEPEKTAEMQSILKRRRALRVQFKKLEQELDGLLTASPPDWVKIKAKFAVFTSTNAKLLLVDEEFGIQLTVEPLSPEDEDVENAEMNEFQFCAEIVKEKVDMLRPKTLPIPPTSAAQGSPGSSSPSGSAISSVMQNAAAKLPEFKIPLFDGDIKKYRSWWGQFSRIHLNPGLSDSDKFGYLVQALKPGSEAAEIIAVYDVDGSNYDNAVAALCDWYGSTDKQRQITMKELLKLVIAQGNAKEKLPLRNLHFKLESFLHILDSVEIDKVDPATWLVHMVEQCLPTKVLHAWKTAEIMKEDKTETTQKTQLKRLMAFMKHRVQVEHEVELSQGGYLEGRSQSDSHRTGQRFEHVRRGEKRRYPALASFHVGIVKSCVFCETETHASVDCFKAAKMEYEDKKDIAYRKRKCFRCLGEHYAKNCSATELRCGDCGKNHVTVMCPEQKKNEPRKLLQGKRRNKTKAKESTSIACSNVVCSSDIILPTVGVIVQNGDRELLGRGFVDGGCQASYIIRCTANKVGLKRIDTVTETQTLIGDHVLPPVTRDVFRVRLASQNGRFIMEANLRHHDKICSRLPHLPETSELARELKRKGIPLSDANSAKSEVDILFGADLIPLIKTGRMEHLETGALATETWFGWTVTGPVDSRVPQSGAVIHVNMALTGKSFSQLWDMEAMGIRDPIEVLSAEENEAKVKKAFMQSVKRKADGRYIVQLPWKDGHPPLVDNKAVAVRRLEATARALRKSGYFEKYGNLFREWEKEGFLERMPAGTVGAHYIPHRAVIKESSATTPVRPVFDASCKSGKNVSLNDCLEKGGNTIQLIPEVMLRFRENRIGFVSDIKKAFQQIEVQESDRDFMRFLWFSSNGELLEYRHARVMFGANCSPFILGAVLELHLSNLPPPRQEMGRRLLESFYVDNCVSSVNTQEEYERFRLESVEVMKDAKMDLCLWFSSIDEFDDPERVIMPVLGVMWDRKRDELFVRAPTPNVDMRVTKRTVLSFIQKVYDSMGFVSPAILPMKILLQRAWLAKKDWDVPLDEDDCAYFQKWSEEAHLLEKIRISRLATGGVSDRNSWTLHTFCDASGKAYGAVIYLRTELDGEVSIELLLAKARLAPIPKQKKKTEEKPKPISIARLELMACLLGTRLCKVVKKAWKVEDVREVYHTDSAVALAWIQRDDKWGTFVGNRTSEINRNTPASSWRHVPGVENPADVVSRGCWPSQLVDSKWSRGPNWLYFPESQWPTSHDKADEEKVYEERCSSGGPCTAPIAFMSLVEEHARHKHRFHTLVRIMGWILRFHRNLRPQQPKVLTKDLSQDEIEKGELALIANIQREFLKKNENELKSLQTFRGDDKVLRVKTKLVRLPDHHQFKFPMILPGKAPETQQLIMDTHCELYHGGVGIVMTRLREKYWILKARQTIRYVLSRCNICRRFRAKPAATPPAPLPLDRLLSAEPFVIIGADIGGPLYLRNGKKVWFVIFTCAVYRGVHFVLINDLSAKSFLKALRQHSRRYRRPAVIYSDNGTNLRGADNLCGQLDWDQIIADYSVSRIQWKFNAPDSPWIGGFFERLIRIKKDLLRRTIGKRSLIREELETVIEDIAEIMNKRPLTYVSEDPEDLEPLTPYHFLHPFGSVAFPEEQLIQAKTLRFRYKYVQTLKQELTQRFRREYLALLVHNRNMKPTRELVPGELVFVGNDNQKRLNWKLGRILRFFVGKEGVKRVAVVKTADGTIIRAAQRLYPLESESPEENKILRQNSIVTRSGRVVHQPKRFKY